MNGSPLRFLTGGLIAGVVLLSAARAATPAPAFIPEEKTDTLNNLVQSAVADFQENHFESALKKLAEADAMQPKSPMILNLIGAIKTKQKDYPAAEKHFEEALATDPGFFPAKFNLGEVKFLRHDYEESLAYFQQMKSVYPKEELVDFKIVMSQLMLDQKESAAKTIERMKFPGNSPAWYYANAAYHLRSGNRAEGMRYVKTARIIFKNQTSLYDESLQDSGLISKS